MEPSLSLGLNLLALVFIIVLVVVQARYLRVQQPALKSVGNCDEQLKDMQFKWETSEKSREKLERKVASQDDIIRSQVGTILMLMDKLGIPTEYPAPRVEIPIKPKPVERSKLSVVGVWAEQASLATLDLKRDLETVIDASGDWTYRPLIGKVSGEDLQNELEHGGGADILYIAAHADEEGVYFSDQKYSPTWVGELAAQYGVKLVVLNACKTRNTAQLIYRKGVPAVVFAMRDVLDATAIAFAKGFFTSLALGKSVAKAVEAGQSVATRFNQETTKSMFGKYGDWDINWDPTAS